MCQENSQSPFTSELSLSLFFQISNPSPDPAGSMAALQSAIEALPSSSQSSSKPSFADMVRGTSVPMVDAIKEETSYKGEPALDFTAMEFLRRGFKMIGFKGDFRLGLLDPKHVLIRFDLEENYHRCWLHRSWRFKNHVMKILKWTPAFNC